MECSGSCHHLRKHLHHRKFVWQWNLIGWKEFDSCFQDESYRSHWNSFHVVQSSLLFATYSIGRSIDWYHFCGDSRHVVLHNYIFDFTNSFHVILLHFGSKPNGTWKTHASKSLERSKHTCLRFNPRSNWPRYLIFTRWVQYCRILW